MEGGLNLRLIRIRYAQALVLLISASLCATSMANQEWHYGGRGNGKGPSPPPPPPCHFNSTTASKKITVGGDTQKWTFGVNYTDWTIKNGPFYLNDTLVFKYEAPSKANTHPHSVYLLPNVRSYKKCDLSRAKLVANETQGGGKGFAFVLKKRKPHYFACGGGAGFHCNNGTMKFVVMPLIRRRLN